MFLYKLRLGVGVSISIMLVQFPQPQLQCFILFRGVGMVDKIIAEIEEELPDGFEHICITEREKAIKYAVENAKAGDIILLAGKGHEDYQLIGGDKIPFCERELILKYAKGVVGNYAFKPEGQKQKV